MPRLRRCKWKNGGLPHGGRLQMVALRKELDSVWIWFYKERATMASNQIMRLFKPALISAGLALIFSIALVPLALRFGILFSGVDTVFIAFVTTAFCAVTVLATAWLFKRKGKFFGWHILVIEVAVLTFMGGGFFSWANTQQALRIFTEPMPVPSGLHVKQGRQLLFTSFVHFTASPADIAAIIQSKKLEEVPDKIPDQDDLSGYGSRQQSKTSWDWWQPTTMSNPKFFFLHHKSEAIQGWSEGWWVNDATNEVYAFISG